MHQTPIKDNGQESRGKLGIFVTTTMVNSSFSMLKDKFYAVHFGAPSAPPRIPLITYGLWGTRDLITIGSSFILPDIVSNILEEEVNLDKSNALRIAQMACPIGMQLVRNEFELLASFRFTKNGDNSSSRNIATDNFTNTNACFRFLQPSYEEKDI